MDTALLTSRAFWEDATPVMAGDRELVGHVLFETSGSTGSPKWIALSKEALLISAQAVNAHLQVTKHSCWGLALPTHHVGGFGVAARAWQAGCRMAVFAGKWNPSLFREEMAAHQVTHTSLVPTQVHDLVQAKLAAPASLRAIVVGGGHLDEATGQAARDLGWPVLASYGMTEACSQI
ncbi:MAG: AMP-binding protein, partial [Verrucomicrobiota bacterium]